MEKLKLALERQKSESLNRRKRAPSSDGLFYGHDLGITELEEYGKKVVTTSFILTRVKIRVSNFALFRD